MKLMVHVIDKKVCRGCDLHLEHYVGLFKISQQDREKLFRKGIYMQVQLHSSSTPSKQQPSLFCQPRRWKYK
jgi:hypothetical protein